MMRCTESLPTHSLASRSTAVLDRRKDSDESVLRNSTRGSVGGLLVPFRGSSGGCLLILGGDGFRDVCAERLEPALLVLFSSEVLHGQIVVAGNAHELRPHHAAAFTPAHGYVFFVA